MNMVNIYVIGMFKKVTGSLRELAEIEIPHTPKNEKDADMLKRVQRRTTKMTKFKKHDTRKV